MFLDIQKRILERNEMEGEGEGRSKNYSLPDRLGATTESSTYAREVDSTWRESQHNFSAE